MNFSVFFLFFLFSFDRSNLERPSVISHLRDFLQNGLPVPRENLSSLKRVFNMPLEVAGRRKEKISQEYAEAQNVDVRVGKTTSFGGRVLHWVSGHL